VPLRLRPPHAPEPDALRGSIDVLILNLQRRVRESLFQGAASALGKHLARFERSRDQKTMCEIVGVIRDHALQSLVSEPRPLFAMPLLQSDERRMTLLAGTAGDPANATDGVRRVIRTLDPNMPLTDLRTLSEYFRASAYPFRLFGLVLGGVGVMAFLLAAVGIYGTVAHSVAQRRREMGIRMALGAVSTDILRLVVAQVMVLVAYGLAIGLVVGAALTRVLTSMPLDIPLLFGVSATDPVTFAGVAIVLALVALTACIGPASRATRVDPVATLRSVQDRDADCPTRVEHNA
jgi:putative ABC transport system permease protein